MINGISKSLSRNDVGATGGHMAGILVNKAPDILGFFPDLDITVKNPRVPLRFVDPTGEEFEFSFIYYNNGLFGGTRNEYRLTGMTGFLHKWSAAPGDTIELSRDPSGNLSATIVRFVSPSQVLKLGSRWRTINMKGL